MKISAMNAVVPTSGLATKRARFPLDAEGSGMQGCVEETVISLSLERRPREAQD